MGDSGGEGGPESIGDIQNYLADFNPKVADNIMLPAITIVIILAILDIIATIIIHTIIVITTTITFHPQDPVIHKAEALEGVEGVEDVEGVEGVEGVALGSADASGSGQYFVDQATGHPHLHNLSSCLQCSSPHSHPLLLPSHLLTLTPALSFCPLI